jgi:hypothetical protein
VLLIGDAAMDEIPHARTPSVSQNFRPQVMCLALVAILGTRHNHKGIRGRLEFNCSSQGFQILT